MEELVPILLQYIRNREKHGGYVLWVAHNARTFDAPFLIHEFIRCSREIPRNWLLLDTLPLARELIKSGMIFSLFCHIIEQKHLMLTLHMFLCRNKPFFSVTGCPSWVLQSWSGWISPQSHGRCEHIVPGTSHVDLWSEVDFIQPCQKIFQFLTFDDKG